MTGMVIDASAVLAILLDEQEARVFAAAMAQADERYISPVNYVEAAIVLDRRASAVGRRSLDALLEQARIEIAAVSPRQAAIAREAYRDFGKGSHPAGLNLGDCFAYALAMELRVPLLFKGSDFHQTDCVPAVR